MKSKLKARILLGIMLLTPVFNLGVIAPEVCAMVGNEDVRSNPNKDFIDAVLCRDYSTAMGLLDKGADANTIDSEGMTVLHHLIQSKAVTTEWLNKLAERGFDFDKADKHGHTPLIFAVVTAVSCNGDVSVVKFLVEHGAKIHATDQVFKYAIDHHDNEVIGALMKGMPG